MKNALYRNLIISIFIVKLSPVASHSISVKEDSHVKWIVFDSFRKDPWTTNNANDDAKNINMLVFLISTLLQSARCILIS